MTVHYTLGKSVRTKSCNYQNNYFIYLVWAHVFNINCRLEILFFVQCDIRNKSFLKGNLPHHKMISALLQYFSLKSFSLLIMQTDTFYVMTNSYLYNAIFSKPKCFVHLIILDIFRKYWMQKLLCFTIFFNSLTKWKACVKST